MRPKQPGPPGKALDLTPSSHQREPSKEGTALPKARPRSAVVAQRSSPEQQAALADLSNGWTRQRVLAAMAVTGSVGGAADVAGVSARSIHYWQDRDPEFKALVDQARRRAGERVLTHLVTSALGASQEQTVRTPTAAIAAINMLLPELRPNGVQVNVDNRQQTINVLTEDQKKAISAALLGPVPEDAELGL